MGDALDNFKDGVSDLLHNKKNVISLLVLLILVLGLPLGIDLIRKEQILKSRAAADPIVFTVSQDVFQKDGAWVTKNPKVPLQLTSPLGPPAGVGSTASP